MSCGALRSDIGEVHCADLYYYFFVMKTHICTNTLLVIHLHHICICLGRTTLSLWHLNIKNDKHYVAVQCNFTVSTQQWLKHQIENKCKNQNIFFLNLQNWQNISRLSYYLIVSWCTVPIKFWKSALYADIRFCLISNLCLTLVLLVPHGDAM